MRRSASTRNRARADRVSAAHRRVVVLVNDLIAGSLNEGVDRGALPFVAVLVRADVGGVEVRKYATAFVRFLVTFTAIS